MVVIERDAATVYAEGVTAGLRLAAVALQGARTAVPGHLWGQVKRWEAETVLRALAADEGRGFRYERSESMRECIERALAAMDGVW